MQQADRSKSGPLTGLAVDIEGAFDLYTRAAVASSEAGGPHHPDQVHAPAEGPWIDRDNLDIDAEVTSPMAVPIELPATSTKDVPWIQGDAEFSRQLLVSTLNFDKRDSDRVSKLSASLPKLVFDGGSGDGHTIDVIIFAPKDDRSVPCT